MSYPNLNKGPRPPKPSCAQGDIIKEVNRQKIQNVRDWKQTTEKMKKGEPLLLLVKRGPNTFYVAIKAAAAKE